MNPFDRAELEEQQVEDASQPRDEEWARTEVHRLVNGTGYTASELDRVHYSRGAFTLREQLVRQAEALVEEWGLGRRRFDVSVRSCPACGSTSDGDLCGRCSRVEEQVR